VDGEHRLLKAAPPALLAVVCAAVVPPVRSGERRCGAKREGRKNLEFGW
jgi:hypothetical protein